ncbi:MAG: type II toxin-antitoxin system RelE/ParE family toxin [Caulobacteraceae bacterium]|nr:MAG: type II toxin-antitoxin system RelE/ParE family toxin [Caulobacteraceae bacterium]
MIGTRPTNGSRTMIAPANTSPWNNGPPTSGLMSKPGWPLVGDDPPFSSLSHRPRAAGRFPRKEKPKAAVKAVEAIAAGIRSLDQFPKRGRAAGSGRELYVPFGDSGYVVQYRIDGDIVFVIRILHMREDRARPGE